MNGALASIRDRLDEIRGRIRGAAARSGRPPEAVTLVGVSKGVPAEALREAIGLGLRDVGENRVQEAAAKQAELGAAAGRATWHMIGHLQRNKAAKAVRCFDWIQSVTDAELASEIARRAAAVDRRIQVLVEVNVSAEPTKVGVAPEALEPLLDVVRRLPGIEVRGLMAIARPVERAEEARRDFAALRELRDRCERSLGVRLPELSMGMSGDFEVAIEEGATLVRVGTALFGARR